MAKATNRSYNFSGMRTRVKGIWAIQLPQLRRR